MAYDKESINIETWRLECEDIDKNHYKDVFAMTYTTIFCIILKNFKSGNWLMCYLFRRYILSNYLNSLSIKKISFSFYSYIPLKRGFTFRIIRLVSQIREISYFLTRTFFTIISRTFPQNFTHLTFHQCYCHQYA